MYENEVKLTQSNLGLKKVYGSLEEISEIWVIENVFAQSNLGKRVPSLVLKIIKSKASL